ncbi:MULTISPECIES: hypothetical protein [Nocardiopsis]|uniref:Uncharacterized protein n=1 Tax=Nocardiopsis changdeensis TaxID=2831969 RepID=A0ABX8BWD4_9ACTN|nr:MULTISPECIES: hypothetical protein [Nocardiopsis]QUX26379.1 hypothetical protein KGD84_32280 [Nocardiopsis changdeensis]QYX40801.1 hypothetical protein K1J57_32895 [Nocardiopsis sp. MT53]
MDPFSALVIAALVTWGTAGGGIKDTSAILKGQTPPSVAYRTARMAADKERLRAWERALAEGRPLPAALEPRRIRIKDLARHWWEDALEDVDAWRAGRRLSRPERKAARAARKEEKKSLISRGYDLIKARGQKRSGADADPDADPDGPAPAADDGGGGEVPDNVVPLHGPRPGRDKDTKDTEGPDTAGQAPDQPEDPEKPQEPEKHPVIDGDRPLFEGASKEELADLTDALGEFIEARDARDRDLARELVASLNTDSKENTDVPHIDLSDAETLSAHLRALGSYADYMDRIAADMDVLAAGMASHQMGHIAVGQVSAAGTANTESAAKCRAVRDQLERAHTVVADARAATPGAADGDYLTRGQ